MSLAGEIKVHCSHSDIVKISELKPNPKNPNKHPESQIELLANIIEKQGWRQPIKVSTLSGYIVSGHGRYEAALFMGAEYVPVDYQDYESEEQEIADLLADNRIAELAEIDEKILIELLEELEETDIDLTGYDKDFMNAINALSDEISEDMDTENEYTKKVETPIYQVTGDTPDIDELYDKSKAEKLIQDIDAAEITESEKEFLKLVAYRHIVFDYRNIAEYYAAANALVQNLMEDSALIIIDFKKAIEHGYAKLKSDISEAIENESDSDDAA